MPALRVPLAAALLAGLCVPAFAGDVTAEIVRGRLVLTGGADGDLVRLRTSATPGAIDVVGDGETTIGGEPVYTVAGLRKDIVLDLGTGNDRVAVDAVELPRGVRVSAAGPLVVNVTDSTIGKDLVVDTLAGGTVIVTGSTVERHLRQDSGGLCLFLLRDSTVGRNLVVKAEGDLTDVSVDGADIGGSAKIRVTGSGGEVVLDGADVRKNVKVATASPSLVDSRASSVGRTLKVLTGEGDDVVNVEETAVRKMKLELGVGTDEVRVRDCTFKRKSVADGGDGDDTAEVFGSVVNLRLKHFEAPE